MPPKQRKLHEGDHVSSTAIARTTAAAAAASSSSSATPIQATTNDNHVADDDFHDLTGTSTTIQPRVESRLPIDSGAVGVSTSSPPAAAPSSAPVDFEIIGVVHRPRPATPLFGSPEFNSPQRSVIDVTSAPNSTSSPEVAFASPERRLASAASKMKSPTKRVRHKLNKERMGVHTKQLTHTLN